MIRSCQSKTKVEQQKEICVAVQSSEIIHKSNDHSPKKFILRETLSSRKGSSPTEPDTIVNLKMKKFNKKIVFTGNLCLCTAGHQLY